MSNKFKIGDIIVYRYRREPQNYNYIQQIVEIHEDAYRLFVLKSSDKYEINTYRNWSRNYIDVYFMKMSKLAKLFYL